MNFFELPIVQLCLSMIIAWGLFAIILGVIHEAVSQVLAERGRFLRAQLQLLLQDSANKLNWGSLIYASPMVRLMTEDRKRPISELPADVFAKALLYAFSESHTVAAAAKRVDAVSPYNDQQLRALDLATRVLGQSDMVQLVSGSLAAAKRKHPDDEGKLYDSVVKDIADWYNALMDRTTSRYRRLTRSRIFYLGLLVAAIFNVNSITLAKYFFASPEGRQNVIAYYQQKQHMLDSLALRHNISLSDTLTRADSEALVVPMRQVESMRMRADSAHRADTVQPLTLAQVDSVGKTMVGRVRDSIDRVKNLLELDSLIAGNDIPVGWSKSNPYRFAYNPFETYQTARPGVKVQDHPFPRSGKALYFFLYALAGMLITAFAGSRGAPFWFDALRKIFSFKK